MRFATIAYAHCHPNIRACQRHDTVAALPQQKLLLNASETTSYAAAPRRATTILDGVAWALAGALGLIVAAELVFFVVHAAHLLRYPYPLDYGEGPLLTQIKLLLDGTPVWQLYADPGQPPYAVVNYPPVYQLLAAVVARVIGDPLLAGRLLSLGAALASVALLWALTCEPRAQDDGRLARWHSWSVVLRLLIVLAFLALPVVREWSVLMRVDLLGVCLGLGGLLLVQRGVGRKRVLWAALLLLLSLYVKPSLIAAPAAALVWLFFRDRRRALILGALLATGGGLIFALLYLASGGWFAIHILTSNANDWQRRLAYGFWHDQLLILWPLVAAAVLGLLARRLQPQPRAEPAGVSDRRSALQLASADRCLLPLYYTLFGAITAVGVGKVGAYANYFLEFYAGLIWLAAAGVVLPIIDQDGFTEPQSQADRGAAPARSAIQRPSFVVRCVSCVAPLVALLVLAALLRYYPTWSASYLKLAGIIEQTNPPRVSFGRYGVWQDLQRERDILQTLAGVNAALVGEVRAAGEPIFTDVPGVAAQAGQLARLQAFEHRQLLDAGLWDQRPLLRDLANGRVPLVVLDYLGNWLTPEMISLISHRYAQDGSRGTYDLYRPVDPGPFVAAARTFPGGPQLLGYHLAPSPGRPAFHAGELLVLTLDWRRATADQPDQPQASYTVVAQLRDQRGTLLSEALRPLLYAALPPSDWGDEPMQHMQPFSLPQELPAGTYDLAITLRADGRDLALPLTLARIVVEQPAGRSLGELGAFVPAPLFDAWLRAGDYAGYGDPLMPAVPFPSDTLQCFVRACLRLTDDAVQRLPLGELIHLGDVGLSAAAPTPGAEERFAETGQVLRGPFLDYWRAEGGAAALGPPITPELLRNGLIVQYTRYARLERPVASGEVGLGRLGEEFLRLPGGSAYRWP